MRVIVAHLLLFISSGNLVTLYDLKANHMIMIIDYLMEFLVAGLLSGCYAVKMSEDERGQPVIRCSVKTTRHLATLNYHWLPKMMLNKLLTAWKCHLRTCIISHYSPIIHRSAVLYSVYLTWQGGWMQQQCSQTPYFKRGKVYSSFKIIQITTRP